MLHYLTPFGLSLSFDRLRMIGNVATSNTTPTPFGLSLPFDRLRMIGNTATSNTTPTPFGLSLSKPCHHLRRHFDRLSPFDKLRMHGHFDKLSANGVVLCSELLKVK